MILTIAGQFKKLSLAGIAEVMGSNPVELPEFFRFMRQLLKLFNSFSAVSVLLDFLVCLFFC